tara:strand:+ start:5178 stop:5372 length:195 start_codon:yes stop_codon:yes gene_type:complete
MTTFTSEEKTKFKARSVTLQNTAWECSRKSEVAYESGQFELAVDLHKTYCKLTEDSIYFEKLSY